MHLDFFALRLGPGNKDRPSGAEEWGPRSGAE